MYVDGVFSPLALFDPDDGFFVPKRSSKSSPRPSSDCFDDGFATDSDFELPEELGREVSLDGFRSPVLEDGSRVPGVAFATASDAGGGAGVVGGGVGVAAGATAGVAVPAAGAGVGVAATAGAGVGVAGLAAGALGGGSTFATGGGVGSGAFGWGAGVTAATGSEG
jgi:hypothetical protein